jgi:prepilin-type N-terminal cleavage/methylation domain-containing protein
MKKYKALKSKRGFTMIELLVVMLVTSILISISLFGIEEARKGTRDGLRKSNLQSISQALEFYRADCGQYPATVSFGGVIESTCTGSNNVYISPVPSDPSSPSRVYSYLPSLVGGRYVSYYLCSSLEGGSATVATGCASANCGSGMVCNYSVKNP